MSSTTAAMSRTATVTCSSAALARALSRVGRAVSTRTTLPILTNILLEVGDGRLWITGTNLELAIRVEMDDVEAEGSTAITVPAKLFTSFIQQLPDVSVSMVIDTEGSVATVQAGSFSDVRFRGIASSEFPPIPGWPDAPCLDIAQGELAQAFEQTVVAAATDEGRPALTGVLMQIGENDMTLAATDSKRLAVRTVRGFQGAIDPVEIIIPAKSCQEISRLLTGDGTVSFTVARGGALAYFGIDDARVVVRTIEGTYPTYSQVIPTEFETKMAVDRAALRECLRAVVLFATEDVRTVKFNIDAQGGTTLGVSAVGDAGQAEAVLRCSASGESVQIAFDGRAVLDALAVIPGESVLLSMRGGVQPCVFADGGAGDTADYRHVLMPLRAQWAEGDA